ncbi:MAG: acyl carrier protein, partial [Symploca sp. SIO1A3]|nr:acyl carrier protein [Symploca sp. SIO1A3]
SLLSDSSSQVGVLPIDWSKFARQLPSGQKIPFLEALISAEPSLTKKSAFREQLEAAAASDSPEQQENILIAYLKNQTAQVLGMKNSQIDVQKPLNTMGLDSLIALELRNQVQRDMEVDIPLALFMEEPTIIVLSNELNKQLNQNEQEQVSEQNNQEKIEPNNSQNSNWIEVEL